jgi:hypothetical protein
MDAKDAAMKRVMSYLFTGLIATTVGIIFLANSVAY